MLPTERDALRKRLVAARQALPDRLERAVALQSVLRVWLIGRPEKTIGAYWPIKGEFDCLPALYRWTEGAPEGVTRRIGLPVAHRETGSLRGSSEGSPIRPSGSSPPRFAGPSELAAPRRPDDFAGIGAVTGPGLGGRAPARAASISGVHCSWRAPSGQPPRNGRASARATVASRSRIIVGGC